MDAKNGYFTDDEEAAEPSDNATEERDEAKTALIPIDFFQGKELTPGHVCKVKIQQVMDDQVSVSYVGSESEEPEEDFGSTTTQPSTPPATDDMFS